MRNVYVPFNLLSFAPSDVVIWSAEFSVSVVDAVLLPLLESDTATFMLSGPDWLGVFPLIVPAPLTASPAFLSSVVPALFVAQVYLAEPSVACNCALYGWL